MISDFLQWFGWKAWAAAAISYSFGGIVLSAVTLDSVPIVMGMVGGVSLGAVAIWQRLKDDRLNASERRLQEEIRAHDETRKKLEDCRNAKMDAMAELSDLKRSLGHGTGDHAIQP